MKELAPMTTAAEIEQFILRCLSDIVGPNFPRSLNPQVSFFDYGIDSLATVTLMTRVSERVGRYVSVDIIFDYPTPRELAKFLAHPASGVVRESGQEG